MKPIHPSRTVPLLLIVSVAVWAASAANHNRDAASGPTGAVTVTFHINAPSTIPAGAAITCNAQLKPRLSVLERITRRTKPIESVGTGVLTGSSSDCTVLLPYALGQDQAGTGGDLSYQISAMSGQRLAAARSQQDIAIPYPLPGVSAIVKLEVSI